ncbi:hypothetical protein TSTA_085810 [Talaromyces stipitatus ATCC 10500]|uniref:Uncharacterized protein n=1 Tax=Talaromyces stipitatus (strain ATCC 10500 / CBS 375.48 / QM 6759 / NRRL 1006) TaxID=441959 RepID=B8M1X2_TALSN|nr:uncharacterized protein TSTA_085810 [Talaromyces stipitatus ATCC 10500]EED21350.1 hypothetical protein TSTA_085810 [Talaromyces stipitatus ATCC 10500]
MSLSPSQACLPEELNNSPFRTKESALELFTQEDFLTENLAVIMSQIGRSGHSQGGEGSGAAASPQPADSPSPNPRIQSKYQKRNWFKRRNGQGKQAQDDQQVADGGYLRQGQERDQHLYQYQQQYPRQTHPAMNPLDSSDPFVVHPSAGYPAPTGQFSVVRAMEAYRTRRGRNDYPILPATPILPTLTPPDLLVSTPEGSTAPPGPLDDDPQNRFWHDMEMALPAYEPPTMWYPDDMDPCQYLQVLDPRYAQESTLRPWATEFVPGRAYHDFILK